MSNHDRCARCGHIKGAHAAVNFSVGQLVSGESFVCPTALFATQAEVEAEHGPQDDDLAKNDGAFTHQQDLKCPTCSAPLRMARNHDTSALVFVCTTCGWSGVTGKSALPGVPEGDGDF